MYKKIVIGIIFVLMIVGFSGCTEVGIEITNIGDINANLDEYDGKEVTVRGNCIGGFITDDAEHTIGYSYDNPISGNYRLTGIIKREYNFNITYIDVTKAKEL